ncbi:MAG TPA: hypothetical protein VMH41_09735 [Mycobacteriales bacterium]|nr:hypothetical protein [Mycobacteriales bacterium]
MTSTKPSLFETEMRAQIAAAEAAVLDALGSADPILVEIARGHLDGLVALARRNGLTVKPLIIDEETTTTISIVEESTTP